MELVVLDALLFEAERVDLLVCVLGFVGAPEVVGSLDLCLALDLGLSLAEVFSVVALEDVVLLREDLDSLLPLVDPCFAFVEMRETDDDDFLLPPPDV